jgi:hypothetical protein
VPTTTICSQTLNEDDTTEFATAVQRHYWYELFIDDLPVWGFVGEVKPATASAAEQYLLYSHKQLDISYNNDKVRAAVPVEGYFSAARSVHALVQLQLVWLQILMT